MICLALVLGILGLMAMRRAHRRCFGHHGYGWHGPWGYGGYDGPSRRHRWMMYGLFRRIDASPAQERAILAEADKLRERLHNAKGGLRDTRADLAAALRGPDLDDAALGAVLGRVDAATGEARGAVIDALRNVHALLDDKQRAQLADLLERNGGWRGGFGPYR